MKNNATLLLMLVSFFFHTNAKAFSQGITLKVTDATLDKVFTLIQKQTNFVFVYSGKQLAGTKKVSVDVTNEKFEKVMQMVMDGQPLKWEVDKEYVIIKQRPSNIQGNKIDLEGSPGELIGRVTNEKGEPIAGATVSVIGQDVSIATNTDGSFVLKGVDPNVRIKITSVGYEPKIILLTSNTQKLLVKLVVTAQSMKEVVVSTGYQDLPKDRATGSFSKIENDVFNRNPSTNVLDRIRGVSSGVLVYGNENSPTGLANISIRGLSTINANRNPLIVMDGFPYDETNNSIDLIVRNLNPNDIESITILKDAAAASIWGVRAGNGVIVITTKKGRYNQKTIIQANVNFSVVNKPDIFNISSISSSYLVDFEDFRFNQGAYNIIDDVYPRFGYFPVLPLATEIRLAARKGTISQEEADAKINALRGLDVRNDINNYLMKKSLLQQYAINISGGGGGYNYYASVGYDKNKFNSVRDASDRLTIRLENYFKPFKFIELGGYANIVYSKFRNNSVSLNQIPIYTQIADKEGNALAIPRDYRITYVDTASYPSLLDWHYKPLDELSMNDNTTTRTDNRIGLNAKFSILPGLKAEVKYQFQKLNSAQVQTNSPNSYLVRNLVNQFSFFDPNTAQISYPIPLGSIVDKGFDETEQWNFRSQLSYENTWGQSNISSIAGFESQESNSKGDFLRLYGFDNSNGTIASNIDFLNTYSIRPRGYNNIPNLTGGGRTSIYRFLSYFGNAAYSYQNKYTLSGSVRMDGANIFGVKANQRVTPLWSTGVLWNLLNERFIQIPWLDQLKLRATYGYNGNTNNGNAYAVIAYRNPTYYSTIPVSYADVLNPPNPELRWEKIRQMNFGVDFSLSNGRLGGSIEYYMKKGIDLIGPIKLDYTTGWIEFIGNRATFKGRGVDINLNSKNIKGVLSWNTSFNFSFTSNKITAYEQNAKTPQQYVAGGVPILGKPLGALYSFKWAGLDPNNGDPRAYISDTIADFNTVYTKAKPEDLVYSGPSTPTVFGGMLNTITWKNLSLSFNIIYKFGYYFRRNSIDYSTLFYSYVGHGDYSKRWKGKGDERSTIVPSLPTSPNSSRDAMYRYSDVLVERGDHIRLQDIRVSFDLEKMLQRTKMVRSASVFICATNLGVIWRANNRKIDPDYGDLIALPGKCFSLGANFNF